MSLVLVAFIGFAVALAHFAQADQRWRAGHESKPKRSERESAAPPDIMKAA